MPRQLVRRGPVVVAIQKGDILAAGRVKASADDLVALQVMVGQQQARTIRVSGGPGEDALAGSVRRRILADDHLDREVRDLAVGALERRLDQVEMVEGDDQD
nr:hypothetical protein [Caulobacter segnis]